MNRCEHLSFLSTLNVQLDGREEHLAKFDKMCIVLVPWTGTFNV